LGLNFTKFIFCKKFNPPPPPPTCNHLKYSVFSHFLGAALLVFALAFAACDNGTTPPAPSLNNISVITQPTKTSYTLGEGFSSTGLTVNAVYSDGSIKEIAAADYALAWNGASLAEGSTAITGSAGNKIVTVTYGGKTVSFTITVNDSVYTISGTITTSDGASPAGAAAQLKQGAASIGSAVSADLNGVYTITEVPAGTYTIDVSLAGYIPGTVAAFAVSNANITGKDLVLQKTSDGDTTPPTEVTGLIGTPGDGTVTLTWTDPADADLDRLEITWTGGSVTATKSTATDRSNSKAVTGLSNGTAYTFTVKTVDTSGNKSQGQTTTATPSGGTNPPVDTTPPAEVAGLTATPGDEAVTLTWTDPVDADLDRLEITWTGGSVTATKSTATDRSNSKVVPGLTNGTAYAFTVKTVDATGNKSQGETTTATPSGGTNPPVDTTPPAEVIGLIGVPGDGTVTLTWTDPVDADLDHFEITWTGGSVTAEKSTAGDRSNSKAVTGLTNGTAYTFTVKAVDASGNASQGETATTTPSGGTNPPVDTTPPAEVTGLTTVAGIGAITLTWTDPADDDLDYIEITWAGGNTTAEKSTAADRANSKVVTDLTSGTAYTFTIKAVDVSGNESQGETVSATPIDIGTGTAFTIASTEDWTNALTQINTGGNGTSSNPKIYYLDIQCAISVGGNSISGSYKTVHLIGSGTFSLPSGWGSIFHIGNSNQTLIIDGPTLNGSMNNNAPLVYVEDGTVELRNGAISGNITSYSSSSSFYGGGVYIGNGTFIMSGGTIIGNGTGSNGGGGVYVAENGTFTMLGGSISDNTAYGSSSSNTSPALSYGGGVYVAGNGTFTLSGGSINDNVVFTSAFYSSARSYGGGVYVARNGTFTMSGGFISDNNVAGSSTYNSSPSYGGGVYSSGTFTMSGGTISGNTAWDGGGVYSGTFTMSEGTISGNTASSFGGGVCSSGTFTKTGGTVYGDTDHIVGNGNATDNTATNTGSPGTNGHAVLYGFYYRNETLANDASGNISTTDTLPAESGDVLNNWTKR
jgi:chitodextrinase